MNTAIVNAVAAADSKAQYDACAKRLVGQKIILAHIMVRTIEEFKGMRPEDVVPLIEGEPQIGVVPVDPGMTNAKNHRKRNTEEYDTEESLDESIGGLNTEDSEINEGTVRFDIIFYVRMKDGLAQIIINVEIQKDQPKEYDLLNRSIYYVSRMISSQKNRDFVKSNYDDLRQVFSIWICLNMDENSLTRYYLMNETILGNHHWHGKQDLLNIVLIGLTKEVPGKDRKYELYRLLSALLSNTMNVQEKIKIIENEYHIPANGDLRKDVNIMCNLGEGIEERAIKETTERVTREVTKEVTKEITEKFVMNMYENHFTLDQIALAAGMSIEEAEAIIEREAALV